MKWIISTEEFAQGKRFETHGKGGFNEPGPDGKVTLRHPKDVITKSFVIYLDSRFTDVLKEEFHKWISYPLPPNFHKKQQINYEVFCGGYLAYYDKGMSNEYGKKDEYDEYDNYDEKNPTIKERRLYLEWHNTCVNIFISNPPKGRGYKDSVLNFIKENYSFKRYFDEETFMCPPSDSDVDPPPPPQPPPPPDA